jgi:hypothetical protein
MSFTNASGAWLWSTRMAETKDAARPAASIPNTPKRGAQYCRRRGGGT